MHDVWASDNNGRDWMLARFAHTHEMRYKTNEYRASWAPRLHSTAVVNQDGLLTMMGGELGDDKFTNEVWQLGSPPDDSPEWYERKSTDDRLNQAAVLLEWKIEAFPPWTGRRGHQSFVDEEGIPYVLGGEDATGVKNDMWKMESSTRSQAA